MKNLYETHFKKITDIVFLPGGLFMRGKLALHVDSQLACGAGADTYSRVKIEIRHRLFKKLVKIDSIRRLTTEILMCSR